MIRYALAVALTVAILGLGAAAVDHGTAVRGETEAETAIEQLDAAAVDLHENEDLALAGNPPPQRVVEVTLPGEGYTSEAAEYVRFERAPGENLTQVAYRIPSRAERSHVIEAPLARAGEGTFRLDGYTGEVTLFLRLVAGEDGHPVVSITVEQ